MTKGLFKNNISKEKIDIPTLFKKFRWIEPIGSIMRLMRKLTNANIDFAIRTDSKKEELFIYIDSRNRIEANNVLEE